MPPTPGPKHIKLASVQDVADELARLYRQTRAGLVPPADASRFAYMLNTLAGLIKLGQLEAHLTVLEQADEEIEESNIETRIQRLEERHRNRMGADGPLTFLRADYDDRSGHVIACEGMTVPLNPPNKDTLGPILAGMAVMVREPNARATCPYDGCDQRGGCRADGSLTRLPKGKSPNCQNE